MSCSRDSVFKASRFMRWSPWTMKCSCSYRECLSALLPQGVQKSKSKCSRPVYGLIFLFKWMEEDPDKQEQSCPEEVWFANQVSSPAPSAISTSNKMKTCNNACASVALLNIVNNIPNIILGENLRAFKDFTATFSPALRGDAIGNFDFVKDIHNSFARFV